MKSNSQQAQSIMRYLLGELSEEEQSRFEAKYFADPDLFHEIRATRDDLIDAYLRGELSPHERERFERYFLSLPHGRESLEFSRTLIETVDHAPLSAAGPSTKQPTAINRKWFLIPQPSFTRVIVAFAVLAIISFGVGLVVRNSRRVEEAKRTPPSTPTNQPAIIQTPASSPSETPKPELANAPPASPPRATPSNSDFKIATFTLTPGALRGSTAKVLLIPKNLNQVELRLEVEGRPYQSYQAELRTAEGDRRWHGTKIKPANDDVPQIVVVKIPATVFENADYVLRLSGVRGNDEALPVSSYYFRVGRK